MKIGLAIYNILSNDSDVSALVSTRIYPNVAKQATPFPFVVYQTTGVDPNDTKDGVSTVDGNSFMVLCYSETYTQVADLAQKVRIALDRKTGTYPALGVEVQSIQFTGYDEDFDIKGDGQGVYVQTVSFNLRQINPVSN
tara:strand:- start:265 stop:681 length:417 start_codon:yes stop_codon:yes gene_type:complete